MILLDLAKNGRYIRIPDNVNQAIATVKDFVDNFYQHNQRMPDESEIYEGVDLPASTLKIVLKTHKPVSIEEPILDNEDLCIKDILKSDEPYDQEAQDEYKAMVSELLSKLSDEDRQFMKDCYGIDQDALYTTDLEEKYGISSEAIRQRKRKIEAYLRTIKLTGYENQYTE